ncbi:AlpA family transcriptional regulator [Geobacter sp. AOG1]|uniref:helix-turn-helix transcriptional regulator n=1 Tax=Geobacter sp. AOG1 TaxID=1566346 RepID=UPI001CC5171C|nr:helix-turn-helix domain-containing protein [Geobacter sp. AOG1]GFE57411.1 hypothetical protein AOG1_12910 [Geobacter sp. AOG1]
MQDITKNEFFRNNPQDRLMDQKEVADMLRISTKTLEYWRWKDIGPKFFKIGRMVRYRMSDVIVYIQGEEVGAFN